jgi:uncharacterized protein (TIGR02271 family)
MLSPSHNAAPGAAVIDVAGQRAVVVSSEHVSGDECVWLRLDGGMQLLVPTAMLTRLDDGGYRLSISFDTAREQARDMRIFMPVMEERAEVGKRKVDTGRGVRIRKTVTEHERLVDEPLLHDEVTVERFPIGQIVEGQQPSLRYEEDTLVVPVLEEVLVVQKRLLLKEEIRITRHRHEVHEPQRVNLRTEHVEVERFDEQAQLMPAQSGPGRNGSGRTAG